MEDVAEGFNWRTPFKAVLLKVINVILWWFHWHARWASEPDDWRLFAYSDKAEARSEDNRPLHTDLITGMAWEFAFFRKTIGLTFKVQVRDDGSEMLQLHWGLPWLFQTFLTFTYRGRKPRWVRRVLGNEDKKTYGFSVTFHEEGCASWCWGHNSDNGFRERRWAYYWWELKGRQTLTKTLIESRVVQFTMPASGKWPDQVCDLTIELNRYHQKWSAWWKRSSMHVAWNVDTKNPPNFEGKYGKDGTFGCSFVFGTAKPNDPYAHRYAATFEEVVERYKALVVSDRKRYG